MSKKHEKPLQLVRLAQMLVRKRGWIIKKKKVLNKDFYRFFGVPPKAKKATCANK